MGRTVVRFVMYLRTLGGLSMEGSSLRRPKPLLLLAYLAIEGPKTRDHLARMFWIEARDPRDSLSTTLRRLNRGGASRVRIHGDRVEPCMACDAVEFERAIRGGLPTHALHLYGGPFLDGLATPLHEESEEWLFATRERLADAARRAHLDLAHEALRCGDAVTARDHAERALDAPGAPPWERDDLEEVQAILEGTGSTRVREASREVGHLAALEGREGGRNVAASRRRTNLPHVATSFVGRDEDVGLLRETFSKSGTRLLTLHGHGGVGKSRLATEAAHALWRDGRVPDGAYFVRLENVADPAAEPATVATALGVNLSPYVPAERQLTAAIADKHVLVVLDNYEHLVGRSELPSVLLEACPNLRIVVTSRRTLNVRAEHVVQVLGLAVETELASNGAVRLLRDRIAQRGPLATPGRENDVLLRRICRLLDGNPLAIELAAALTRALPLEELAAELETGLHLLVDPDSGAAERRKSLKGALDVSWNLLPPDHQEALAMSSVFRGGFRRRAAREVGDVELNVLTSLIDAAVIRVLPSGRFEHHPLVHRFAEDRLAELPALDRSIRERHGRYYLGRLAEMDHDLHGGATSTGVIAWIEQEFANIAKAWEWAVGEGEGDLLERATWAIAHFAEFRGRYVEVRALFEIALRPRVPSSIGRGSPVGHILACSAFLDFRLGHIDQAIQEGTEALELLEPERRGSGNWGLWTALESLGMSYLTLTDAERAREHLDRAVALCAADHACAGGDERFERIADLSWATSLEALAYLELHAGNFDGAVTLLRSGEQRMAPHRCPSLGYLYWTLGQTYLAMGRVRDAEASLQEALDFSRETGFQMLVGHILNDLSRVHLGLCDAERADGFSRRALEVALESGDKWLETSVLAGAGLVAMAAGQAARARECFVRSLSVARTFKGYGFACEALLGLADLASDEGDGDRSVEILGFLRASPLAPRAVAYAAEKRLQEHRQALDAERFDEAIRRGKALRVEDAFAPPEQGFNPSGFVHSLRG